MSPRPKVSPNLRAFVRERANYRCEYCHALEAWQYVEFTVEHVVPLAAGGESTEENLALACFGCNRRKSDRQVARDPETDEKSRLFHPRQDTWNDHFTWSVQGVWLSGVSAVGRATVAALEMNRERAALIREADLALGRHPPSEDRRVVRGDSLEAATAPQEVGVGQ